MALKFNSVPIPCGNLHTHLEATGGRLQVSRQNYWGLAGVTELRGEVGEESVIIQCWLNNSYTTVAQVLSALTTVRGWRGDHGILVQSGGGGIPAVTIKNCTLDAVDPISLPGQISPEPREMVDTNWMYAVQMSFTTLKHP